MTMDSVITHQAKRKTLEIHPGPLADFNFPPYHRLLITTSCGIFSLSGTGLELVLESSAGGIVAAQQSEDDSGFLAVADGLLVVIRKPRDSDRRYRLKPAHGQAGLLSFANNSKELIFTTAMSNSLHRYEVEQNTLLESHCTHPSPPIALAVSIHSTYVVSASASPPIVYLQSYVGNYQKIDFKPRPSTASVTVTSFHPDRNEIFLLAYGDGTISVHSASRIVLMRSTGSDGCLGHLRRIHNVTTTHSRRLERRVGRGSASSAGSATIGDRSVGITAASFIKGYKLRVVSVAGDGRCRIVDFERGVDIIRSWSAQAACSSLAVFSFENDESHLPDGRSRSTSSSTSSTEAEPHRSDNPKVNFIIAVGRVDGILLIFDAAGLLRVIKGISNRCGSLINLAWTTDSNSLSKKQFERSKETSGKGIANVRRGFEASTAESESKAQPENCTKKDRTWIDPRNVNLPMRYKTTIETSLAADQLLKKTARNNSMQSPHFIPSTFASKSLEFLEHDSDESTEVCNPNAMINQKSLKPPQTRVKFAGVTEPNRKKSQRYNKEPRAMVTGAPCVPLNKNSRRMPGSWADSSSSSDSVDTEESEQPHGHGIEYFTRNDPTNIFATERRVSGSKVLQNNAAPVSGGQGRLKRDVAGEAKVDTKIEALEHLVREQLAEGAAAAKNGFLGARRLGQEPPKQKPAIAIRDCNAQAIEPILNGRNDDNFKLAKHRILRKPVSLAAGRCSTEAGKVTNRKLEENTAGMQPFENMKSSSRLPDVAWANTVPTNLVDENETAYATSIREYSCAEVVREEMALVRAEIAALRKGLWVFGSRVASTGRPPNFVEEWDKPANIKKASSGR